MFLVIFTRNKNKCWENIPSGLVFKHKCWNKMEKNTTIGIIPKSSKANCIPLTHKYITNILDCRSTSSCGAKLFYGPRPNYFSINYLCVYWIILYINFQDICLEKEYFYGSRTLHSSRKFVKQVKSIAVLHLSYTVCVLFLSYMCFMEAGSDHFVFLSFNTMYLQNENAKIRRRKCEKFHNAFSHFRFVNINTRKHELITPSIGVHSI